MVIFVTFDAYSLRAHPIPYLPYFNYCSFCNLATKYTL